jgi:predicted DNA-binding transcriptional regulator AlpA
MASEQLTPSPSVRYVRAKAICTTPGHIGLLPIGHSTLWRWVNAGTFPKPVKLSGGVTAWMMSDITAWLAAKEQADGGQQ